MFSKRTKLIFFNVCLTKKIRIYNPLIRRILWDEYVDFTGHVEENEVAIFNETLKS